MKPCFCNSQLEASGGHLEEQVGKVTKRGKSSWTARTGDQLEKKERKKTVNPNNGTKGFNVNSIACVLDEISLFKELSTQLVSVTRIYEYNNEQNQKLAQTF